MPDEIDQLITEFRRQGPAASPTWKLGIVMDLERLPDDRIVPFLVEVLIDRRQPTVAAHASLESKHARRI